MATLLAIIALQPTLPEDVEIFCIAFAASTPVRAAIELDHAVPPIEVDVARDAEVGHGADLARGQGCGNECCCHGILAATGTV